jgi:hypothetical protein
MQTLNKERSVLTR